MKNAGTVCLLFIVMLGFSACEKGDTMNVCRLPTFRLWALKEIFCVVIALSKQRPTLLLSRQVRGLPTIKPYWRPSI